MIRSAYLAPTERPVRLIDVKKALLTFDRVMIPDPEDRDLFPSQAFTLAMGMPPIISLPVGPIRPLGKTADYDAKFDELMDGLASATRQDLVEVVSTYRRSEANNLVIGRVDMGGYPLNPQFLLWAYRSVAQNDSVLQTAIRADNWLMSQGDDHLEALSIAKAQADGAINDSPALSLIEGKLVREHLRKPLTSIARARIASTIKSIGYCSAKELVPLFTDSNSESLVTCFAQRASETIDFIAEDDPYWTNRRMTLRVAHQEYIDDTVLDQMSIDDVIQLRTSVWGHQAEARDSLLNSVAELSKAQVNEAEFEASVREKIAAYRQHAVDVKKQREALSFDINCELSKLGVGTASSLLAGSSLSGVFSQMQTAVGAASLLLAGCLWAGSKIQDLKPARDQLQNAEEEARDNVCFGLHNFYRKIGKSVGSAVDR
ncbi:hypothetical protein [Aurantiacibacter sp. D1-12]|uniref:hypothetical protein n=1 Tax=Aurantiacibacter sp. D1-12 TaxID=2993658 RepID=UPI00237D046F|nr:hypothetical protein [Aurantiacibacter sp. D1-12]MDE1467638.1 hypothetical protein [Aurantiacibacter sp. D1-12]